MPHRGSVSVTVVLARLFLSRRSECIVTADYCVWHRHTYDCIQPIIYARGTREINAKLTGIRYLCRTNERRH
jgi:hypothetical protein